MGKKVAVISMSKTGLDEECEYMVARSITNWTEVTDDAYVALKEGIQNRNYYNRENLHYLLVEEPVQGQKEVILEMIEAGMEIAKKRQQQKEELAKKEAERKAKLANRTKKSKQEQLDKLARELGVEVVPKK